jgi:branched-chain amino acid transport system permease protein
MLGPTLGSITFWFLVVGTQSFLQQAVQENFVGIGSVLGPSDVGPVRFIIVGMLLMLLPIFRPQGFLGSREEAMLDE